MEMSQEKCQVLLLLSEIRAMGCGQPEGEKRILKKPVKRILAHQLLALLATKQPLFKHL